MSEEYVRIDCVVPLVLEIIGPQFVQQANPSPLLAQIDDDPCPCLPDYL